MQLYAPDIAPDIVQQITNWLTGHDIQAANTPVLGLSANIPAGDIGTYTRRQPQKPDWWLNIQHHCPALMPYIPRNQSPQATLDCHIGIRRGYEPALAGAIARLAVKSMLINESQLVAFQTVLHEALLNALLHSHLDMQSAYDDLDSFNEFHQAIQEKLQKLPGYLWIGMRMQLQTNGVTLSVTNQLRLAEEFPLRGPLAMHGRGLNVMRHFCKQAVFYPLQGELIASFNPPRTSPAPADKAALSPSILIVDDTAFNLRLLDQMLRINGYSNIHTAMDGRAALDMLPHIAPDLVILDLMMPVMNGYEFCQALRAMPAYANLPVLVQTALTSPDEKTRAFDAGATDLITKPIGLSELLARTRVHLENRAMLKHLHNYRDKTEQELAEAGRLQQTLLPTPRLLKQLEKTHHLQVSHYTESSYQVGGDFWQLVPLDAEHVAISNIDISGHGISAAFNSFRLHTLLETLPDKHRPDMALASLNVSLQQCLPRGHFATMFYGVLNISTHELAYATAACPPPLLYRAGQNACERLTQPNYPLGVMANATFKTHVTPFMPGDSLLLYSDALLEAYPAGQAHTPTHVSDIEHWMKEKQADGPDALVKHILRGFHAHGGGAPVLHDDLTIAALKRLPA
ncbi:SpoIIE family protein phosphatase [bacterium]|nr:SpoIIE family protein phosphatase [bacterium]